MATPADVMRLIRRAEAALHGGAPADALRLADEHAANFPRGGLREERHAVRVAALCALDRVVEARAEADRLLREAPTSIYVARVRASCAGR